MFFNISNYRTKMETITEKDLLKTDPELKNRPYQIEALLSIFLYAKCLVKMFCGTGKSRIITNVIIHEKKELSVVVFPSLALISQYSFDYLNNVEYIRHFKKHKTMNVSSESLDNMESTTEKKEIKKFMKLKSPKIILVTYQSYQVLLDCLEGKKIGIVCYDEAHHVVSPETQKLVFGTDYFEKEVFFTATPKNENGITMFDRDDPEKNMCGPVAYDYTYLQGLVDEVLNAFEICIDMYTENTNASIYEAMARAILSKGTSRVLSFHSGVNGESNTNVWNFVNEAEFQIAFTKVQKTEFPEKKDYTKITFKGMDGNTPSIERKAMLKALDDTPDNEIYIIASCETIGEGVDTKKANMCLFADPKSSITKIIQNIGRVVRRNKAHPLSTILIPCWVNMENYAAANGDRAKQDELIRQQMRSEKGDYAAILNVLGALKQEDPELYEMCLDYSDSRESDESEVDFDEEETVSEDDTESVSEENMDSVSEADTDSVIASEADTEDRRPNKRIRMSIHQNDAIQMLWGVKGELDFSQKFCSVVIECEVVKIDQMKVVIGIVERAKAREANGENLLPKYKHKRRNEIEKQETKDHKCIGRWKRGESKLSNVVREYLDSNLPNWDYVLTIENKEMKALSSINELIDRALKRQKKNKNFIPILRINATKKDEEQETIDARRINNLKQKMSYPSIKNVLDERMHGWDNTNDWDSQCIEEVYGIIQRAEKRILDNPTKKILPTEFKNPKNSDEEQEISDKRKLQALHRICDTGTRGACPIEVQKMLDEKMPGWRPINKDEKSLNSARSIIERAQKRQKLGLNLMPSSSKISDEHKDYNKLNDWKSAVENNLHMLKTGKKLNKSRSICSDDVKDLLDKELPGWRPFEPIQPIAPPPKKRKLILKKQTAIPIATITETPSTTPHHFPSPSEIGILHKKYLKMRSDTLHAKFKTEPQLWLDYHATRKSNFATYDPASIPSNQIIRELEKIQTKRRKVVVDMGCGEAPIAHHFLEKNDLRFTFHNYDHQSGGDLLIQEVDISALPLDDASVEIGIMSLALWGTHDNCTQYIKEAYRVLESGGKFYISDSTKKWSPEQLTPENGGDVLRTLLTTNGFKIMNENIGSPFCLFVCAKIY
jgi:superfamily II DNA or RNA helicase